MGEYKHKQFMARMNLNTYKRLRRAFKAEDKESANDYFTRLAKYLEEKQK